MYANAVKKICEEASQAMVLPDTVAVLRNTTEKISASSKLVAKLLNDISVESSVLEVFLFDYIEQLVRWAVGPTHTAEFIRQCITSSRPSEQT